MTCLNIWQPLKRIQWNEFTAAFFFIEFIVVTLLTGVFLLPITCYSSNPELLKGKFLIPMLIFFGLATFLIVFFSMASFRNPGYVKREASIDF